MKSVSRFCSGLLVLAFTATAFAATPPQQQTWKPVGPEGGDARSFAYDPAHPSHMYLGTVSGWIYESQDGGANWTRLANLSNRSDLVLDHILVDPATPTTLLVGAWVLGSSDGGLWRSTDSGHTWTSVRAMAGQSVRALARSASDPKILVAGTLQGVFESTDNGDGWTRISPPENAEIHEVESVAIDPKNPQVIYAGTWHLPWKTEDGGKHWFNIKQGLIDDSDVFSIILDPVNPHTVFLSACSGIYKSTDSAGQFTKIQGIPSTARRTRVLKQDPQNREVVYAGTTEGLYKTTDGGKAWVRMTGPDVIVNDVYVDPSNDAHVMLATDRSGILNSTNSAVAFADANRGFMQRQVSAIATDPRQPQHMYASVLNDKTFGGVFESTDGGQSWQQHATGLAGRDVYSLQVAEDGTVLAGTNRGVMQLAAGTAQWQPSGKVINSTTRTTTVTTRNKKTHKLEKHTVDKQVADKPEDLTARVSRVWMDGANWFAATDTGLYKSTNAGATWTGGPVMGEARIIRVVADKDTVFAASPMRLFVSSDAAANFTAALMPQGMSRVATIATSPDGLFWVAGPEGVWVSHDRAASWDKVPLPINDISNIDWDASMNRMLVTSWKGNLVFGVSNGGKQLNYWTAGWEMRSAHSANGHLFGASLFNSVVMDPAPLSSADLAPGHNISGSNGAQ